MYRYALPKKPLAGCQHIESSSNIEIVSFAVPRIVEEQTHRDVGCACHRWRGSTLGHVRQVGHFYELALSRNDLARKQPIQSFLRLSDVRQYSKTRPVLDEAFDD